MATLHYKLDSFNFSKFDWCQVSSSGFQRFLGSCRQWGNHARRNQPWPRPWPKPRFKSLMSQQQWKHGGYWLCTLHLDAAIWLKLSRPRRQMGRGLCGSGVLICKRQVSGSDSDSGFFLKIGFVLV